MLFFTENDWKRKNIESNGSHILFLQLIWRNYVRLMAHRAKEWCPKCKAYYPTGTHNCTKK